MTRITRTTLVKAPLSSVMEYVGDFFRQESVLRVETVARVSAPVIVAYELIDDATDVVRRHDACAIRWRPNRRFFPGFRGVITARPHFARACLSLEGEYVPPGGMAGAIFDALVGRWIARDSLGRLLREVADYAESRYRQFESGSPTIEQLNTRPPAPPR